MDHGQPHLLDDGPGVQIRGGVMSRSANNLDSACVRLVVRLSPHERREETAVRSTKSAETWFGCHFPVRREVQKGTLATVSTMAKYDTPL